MEVRPDTLRELMFISSAEIDCYMRISGLEIEHKRIQWRSSAHLIARWSAGLEPSNLCS